MTLYNLYSIDATTIQEARAIVEKLLSISLKEHDSSYHRGPYFSYGQIGEENFEVKENVDPYDDEPNENEFPDHRFLLYVNNSNPTSALTALLSDAGEAAVLLRSENLD